MYGVVVLLKSNLVIPFSLLQVVHFRKLRHQRRLHSAHRAPAAGRHWASRWCCPVVTSTALPHHGRRRRRRHLHRVSSPRPPSALSPRCLSNTASSASWLTGHVPGAARCAPRPFLLNMPSGFWWLARAPSVARAVHPGTRIGAASKVPQHTLRILVARARAVSCTCGPPRY